MVGPLLLIACPAGGAGNGEAEVGATRASPAMLRLEDGVLSLEIDAGITTLASASPLPYSIVAAGAVSLVTTCGPDLVPITWATDGATVHRYPDTLPLIVQPPIIALAGLPADVAMAASGLTLLGTDGAAIWSEAGADLLWHVAGDADGRAYCVIPAHDADPIAPYGVAPLIVCVECPGGNEAWRTTLPNLQDPVLDLTLLALGSEYGLLQAQHGYDDYSLYSLHKPTGTLLHFHSWQGQPAREAVYPGPLPQQAGVELDGDQAVMRAYVQGQGWRRWTIDIREWRLISDVTADPPAGMREDNPHPVGGSGAPAPPLFPQRLLPTAHGASWTIPALLNDRGEVLVVTAKGASWVAP